MNFVKMVEDHGKTMPKGAPPILVAHPEFGELGCVSKRGFVPIRGRWSIIDAILRDADREELKALRKMEDNAPSLIVTAIKSFLKREPYGLPYVMSKIKEISYMVLANQHGAITTYDGIVTARGSGAMQDVWMNMTATQTSVTLSWYDLMSFTSWQPMTAPSYTAFTAGTGGSVMDAPDNGSWLTNPTGTNKKYIVSMGLNVNSITGFSLAMLYDCLWAGTYSITSNTTITATAIVPVTRYSSTTPGNAEYSGGNMMQATINSATITHTVAPVLTTTYQDQGGTATRTTISTMPATGIARNRIVGNTTHNTATVVTASPFMPLTNNGASGVIGVKAVQVSGGTCTVGALTHKIVRPLILMPFIAANSFIEQDTTLNIGNMVELHNVSQVCGCLGFNVFSAGTTAAAMSAFIRTVEG